MEEDVNDEYRRPLVTEDTIQVSLIGAALLALLALLLFFGRACDQEETRHRQLKRASAVECVKAGHEPLLCAEAFGALR